MPVPSSTAQDSGATHGCVCWAEPDVGVVGNEWDKEPWEVGWCWGGMRGGRWVDEEEGCGCEDEEG